MLVEIGCHGPLDVLQFGTGYGDFTVAPVTPTGAT